MLVSTIVCQNPISLHPRIVKLLTVCSCFPTSFTYIENCEIMHSIINNCSEKKYLGVYSFTHPLMSDTEFSCKAIVNLNETQFGSSAREGPWTETPRYYSELNEKTIENNSQCLVSSNRNP